MQLDAKILPNGTTVSVLTGKWIRLGLVAGHFLDHDVKGDPRIMYKIAPATLVDGEIISADVDWVEHLETSASKVKRIDVVEAALITLEPTYKKW